MTLCVFGDVNQQSTKSDGNSFASEFPYLSKLPRSTRQDHGRGALERCVQTFEESGARWPCFLLRLQLGKLSYGQLAPLRIRDQTVDATGDVQNVKPNWRDIAMRLPELLLGKRICPLRQVLTRVLQRIEDRRMNRIVLLQMASHPWFHVCFYSAHILSMGAIGVQFGE